MRPVHLSASYARILFRHLKLTEQNGQRFFAGTDFDYQSLMSLDQTLSFEDQFRLFQNALAIYAKPGLGLSVGKDLQISSHGPLGVAAFSSSNLKQALLVMAKYSDIRTQFMEVTAQEEGDQLAVYFNERLDLQDLRLFLFESLISSIYSAISFFTGSAISECEIHFSYPEPDYPDKYRESFACRLSFGHSASKFLVPKHLYNYPSPVADESLHNEALKDCERVLANLHVDRLSERHKVEQIISQNPGRIWNLEEIADYLYCSKRTLIRRLKQEGTSFQEIRDEIAKRQACMHLANDGTTVADVAYMMGFSDVSSFRRSFKRWCNETPSDYVARVKKLQD